MSETPDSTTPSSLRKASGDDLGAELFRALGHPVRVRVLELLRARKEMSVRELHAALQIDSGGVSQHLGALRRQRLLATRRQGTSVFYRVPDPRTFRLLDLARLVLTSQVRYAQTLLDGLNQAHIHRDGRLDR